MTLNKINPLSKHAFYDNSVLYIAKNPRNGKSMLYLDLNVIAAQHNITIDRIFDISKCVPSINNSIVKVVVEGKMNFAVELRYFSYFLRLISLTCFLFLDSNYLREWDYEINLFQDVANGNCKVLS